MSKKTNEIRKRIQIAEQRKGRELTEKERQKIERKVILKYRRENFIRGAFLAVGIAIGAGGHALLTDGSNTSKDTNNKQSTEMQIDNQEKNNNSFKEDLKYNTNTIIPEENENNEIDYDKIISEILEEYNEKYNTELSSEDISYIKSNPQFLGISDDGTYIQDYKQDTPTEEYIYDDIKDIYVMINNRDNTIITSLGKVEGEIKNIDTKVVMDSERNEYFESDKKIDLTENKKQEQIEQIYDSLKNEYEKEIEEER